MVKYETCIYTCILYTHTVDCIVIKEVMYNTCIPYVSIYLYISFAAVQCVRIVIRAAAGI